jgi:hypothetical protein
MHHDWRDHGTTAQGPLVPESFIKEGRVIWYKDEWKTVQEMDLIWDEKRRRRGEIVVMAISAIPTLILLGILWKGIDTEIYED